MYFLFIGFRAIVFVFSGLLSAWQICMLGAAPVLWESWRGTLSKTHKWASGLWVFGSGEGGIPSQSFFSCSALFHPPPFFYQNLPPDSPRSPSLLQNCSTLHSFPSSQIRHCHNIINMQISLKEPLRSNECYSCSLGCGALIWGPFQ